jgi:hypothetical protein
MLSAAGVGHGRPLHYRKERAGTTLIEMENNANAKDGFF